MPEFIETEIRDGVAFATLNRPEKRNALSRALIQELNDFVSKVAEDDAVRVFVLQARGKVFCAGMDLAEMQSRAKAEDPEAEWQFDSDIYNELVSRIFSLKMPTVAALQGPVLAGGTGMVFACDLVIASEGSFISLPEPKRGIVAAMVCPLLVYRTNISTASYLLLSGKSLSSAQAHLSGLFHELAAEDEFDKAKFELLNSILTGSPAALQSTKNHLSEISKADVLKQIRDSSSVSAAARRSLEAQEGLAAFNEKRKPSWEVEIE